MIHHVNTHKMSQMSSNLQDVYLMFQDCKLTIDNDCKDSILAEVNI